MKLEAVYERGMLRLMQPIDLPEGTRVEITLVKSNIPCRLGGATAQPNKTVEFLAATSNLQENGEGIVKSKLNSQQKTPADILRAIASLS